MGDSGNREAMSTYSPAHIFVRSLEETCAYMGRDEEANDDARAPTTVGKPVPDTVPVVSAVGHGALAVAVPGGNTAVDAPAAALAMAGGAADTVAEATGGELTSTGGSTCAVRAITDCSIECISVSIWSLRSKRRRTLSSHWERLAPPMLPASPTSCCISAESSKLTIGSSVAIGRWVVAAERVRPRTDDARPCDAGRPRDDGCPRDDIRPRDDTDRRVGGILQHVIIVVF